MSAALRRIARRRDALAVRDDSNFLHGIAEKVVHEHRYLTQDELRTNRGPTSRAANVAWERTLQMTGAALGRILVNASGHLLWVDAYRLYPTIAEKITSPGTDHFALMEVPVWRLRIEVATILLIEMGLALGVSTGDGFGLASTTGHSWF